MKVLFLIIATVITVGSVIPYIRDILRGSTKPNLVSWITWTLLTGMATSAEIAANQYVVAIFTGSATLGTALVIVFGLTKKAYVTYSRLDVLCQVAVLIGIILWQIFDSPVIGVVASVMIDLVGAVPTLHHAYKKPDEETWQAFALASGAAVFGLLALDSYNWISLPYPIYLIAMNAAITGAVFYGRRMAALSTKM